MRAPAVLLAASLALPAAAADRFDGGGSGGGGLLGSVRRSEVPEIVGREVTPSGEAPAGGHNVPSHHASQYDIWKLNCHTQANSFAAQAAMRGLPAGVLACQGNPESSPQFHTANWAVQPGGQTCIMNWGQTCCWEGASSPPDLSDGRARQCAQWACGDQYKEDQTRAMEPGKLVESPGPHSCAVEAAGGPPTLLPGMAVTAMTERRRTGAETVQVPAYPHHPDGATLTFTEDRLEPCLRCCEQRASLWSGVEGASVTPNLAAGREDTFRRQCLSTCRGAFLPPRPR